MKTFYEVLDIPVDASQEEIKKSYDTLLAKYNPNEYFGDRKYAEEMIASINVAYKVLSDHKKRALYDIDLRNNFKSNNLNINGANQTNSINKNNAMKERHPKIYPWYISWPIIIFVLILFLPFRIIWITGFILLIARIFIVLKKRKGSIVIPIIVIILLLPIEAFYRIDQNKMSKIEGYINRKSYQEAITLINDELEKGNNSSELFLLYSKCYEAQKNYDESALVLITALEDNLTYTDPIEERLTYLQKLVSLEMSKRIEEEINANNSKEISSVTEVPKIKIENENSVPQESTSTSPEKAELENEKSVTHNSKEINSVTEVPKIENENSISQETTSANSEKAELENGKSITPKNEDPIANETTKSVNIESNDEETDIDKLLITDARYLDYYIKKYSIKLNTFSSSERIKKKLKSFALQIKDSEDEPIYLTVEDKLLSQPYFKRTMSEQTCFYIGELKNNLPNGVGIIIEAAQDLVGEYSIFYNKYMGEFKDGRYNGYGMFYNVPDSNDLQSLYEIYGDNYIDYITRLNYMTYEGNFKNGKFSGKGNYYDYPRIEYDYIALADPNYLSLSRNIGIIVSNFSDDLPEGKGKVYAKGYLSYEGNMRKGEYNGTGVLYFPLSEQVKYKGSFKNGKYNGKGTLYDENGNVVYSGQWKNGDYK